MIFLFKQVIFRFHVNFPGCSGKMRIRSFDQLADQLVKPGGKKNPPSAELASA